ncbi:LCP family protein [Egicoccus sp. AB-alg6-2]|uniref:LCP family protein n=1 Tax=Egicoccus sp. AB-alg6-2 TaxID=3242692 RepID=UPI00359ED8E1
MSAEVDQDWGPRVRGRGRRRRRVPVVRILAALVLVVLLVAVLFAAWVTSRIPKIDVGHLAGSGSPLHVLVVGSDSREALSAEERNELSTGSAEGERTDTIFLLTVHRGDAALLAFPRDLLVRRCDGSEGRINAAVQVDGPGCLVRTVSDLSGIPIHHYVEVTFGGFRDVVDAVDGVEMCLEEPINDRDAGIDLAAGCQTLDGRDALGFVRVRKIDDDYGRIGRQQAFLRALAGEIADPATLFDPRRILGISNEMGDAVATDRRMGVIPLARVAWGGRALADGRAITHVVPADPGRTSGGAAVLYVRQTEAEPLFRAFRDGSVLDTEPSELTPGEVSVRVLNGAGIAGLAGQVGELLTSRGYEVAEIGNADPTERTVVRYPPGAAVGAGMVAAEVPGGAATEESPDVSRITLILGRDAAGSL